MFNFACKSISMEEIVRCGFKINKTEYKVLYQLLKAKSELTLNEIARELKKNRTTVQKGIKGLLEKKMISRRQMNLDNGGYVFVYKAHDKEKIKSDLLAIISKWKEAVDIAIRNW
ncbi:MAG: helix-turn-helix domain-containing protein [Candidatus Woesearchaeota archaeon]